VLITFSETIVRIAVGRTMCLALGQNGNLHVVETGFSNPTNLKFTSSDINPRTNLETYPVIRMAAGWCGLAAAVLNGIGLMIWTQGDSKLLGDGTSLSFARRIKVFDEIGGLMAGEGFLVYLMKGEVRRVNVSKNLASSNLTSIHLKKFVTTPKLSYLSGNFQHFGPFNSEGRVLIGHEKTARKCMHVIIDELQRREVTTIKIVVSIAAGGWHSVALVADLNDLAEWRTALNPNHILSNVPSYLLHITSCPRPLYITLNTWLVSCYCILKRRQIENGYRGPSFHS
jgi:hypothetical protein